MPVPVHRARHGRGPTWPCSDGFPQVFEPGTGFAYCNGGYVVLALLAERGRARPVPRPGPAPRHRSRRPLPDGVPPLGRAARRRGARLPPPRGPRGAAADQRPPPAGLGGRRRRHLHHGRRRADAVARAGRRQGRAPADLAEMRRVRSTAGDRAYGLGVWLEGDSVYLTGSDTGASFLSQHLPGRFTWSVLGNATDGAWPVSRASTSCCRWPGRRPTDSRLSTGRGPAGGA